MDWQRGKFDRNSLGLLDIPICISRISSNQTLSHCAMLIGLCSLLMLGGCLGRIVSHYRSIEDTNNAIPVFVPSVENPLHAPLFDSTIKSLVEAKNGDFVAATQIGWLRFDSEFEVQDSGLFRQKYGSVSVISTAGGLWVYGTKLSRDDQSLREHNLYRLDTSDLESSFECHSDPLLGRGVGHPVADFNGDGFPSLVVPCQSKENHYYIAILDLKDGSVSSVAIPFQPRLVLLKKSVRNRHQSIHLLAGLTTITHFDDMETPSPVYRELNTVEFNNVVLSIEQVTSGTYLKSFSTHPVPEVSTSSNEINSVRGDFFVDAQGELLHVDAVYPGDVLLNWGLDGSLKNWWYFDVNRNFRSASKWFVKPSSQNQEESLFAVLYGLGHWCQWSPCGFGIFQLSTNGDYKLIDFTTNQVDSILITNDGRLVASWTGKIFQYDLDTVRSEIPWQSSVVPAEHLAWMSKHSGFSETEIRESYIVSDEEDLLE